MMALLQFDFRVAAMRMARPMIPCLPAVSSPHLFTSPPPNLFPSPLRDWCQVLGEEFVCVMPRVSFSVLRIFWNDWILLNVVGDGDGGDDGRDRSAQLEGCCAYGRWHHIVVKRWAVVAVSVVVMAGVVEAAASICTIQSILISYIIYHTSMLSLHRAGGDVRRARS